MKNFQAKKLIVLQKKMDAMIKEFPTKMGVEARNHFVQSFDKQGFTDQTLDPWKKRKSKKDDSGRAILVKTGDLKKSIRVIRKLSNGVVLGSDLPYAKIHNAGGRGKAWGKWPFTMPKRLFMGYSTKLMKKLRNMIRYRIKKIF